ncbi:MAG TPA: acyl-CoA dehydrogenase family protein [Cryptosporangiaceae bacterium]|nr:acyl-CoA dehydrogenase family protein [Cryptosporangiaceae bacterium]
MKVERFLPHGDAYILLDLVHEIAEAEVRPLASEYEAQGRFPREVFRTLGEVGLLGLPYEEKHGGANLPYEVYLQVVEELAAAWLTVGLGVSVHTLSCFPVAMHGSDDQKAAFLPAMLSGEKLGAYCLSETEAGSDAAALRTTATRDGESYVVRGTKAWVTHGGVADFYNVLVRTGEPGPRGISLLLVDPDTPGMAPQRPERKMGLAASPTAQIVFDDARVPADRLVGREGQGFKIALAALDGGRLGVAACAVGLAQAALDYAVGYAGERKQFGQPVAKFQGLAFLLADMATQVAAARALYIAAARLRDSGRASSAEAAKAKLFATDMAMRVTTDAVQVLGGAGYVADHPVERWMREAKMLQIVEGTNQIQRVVIARTLCG